MFPSVCYVKVFFVQYFPFQLHIAYRPSFQWQNILLVKTSLINYLSDKIHSSSWNIIFVYSRYESSVTEYKSSLEESMKAAAERSQNKENKSSETTTSASSAATFLVNEVWCRLCCRHCLTLVSRDLKIQQWRRQRKRHKSNRFNEQNNNFACASRFFVHFFAVTAQLQCENT